MHAYIHTYVFVNLIANDLFVRKLRLICLYIDIW